MGREDGMLLRAELCRRIEAVERMLSRHPLAELAMLTSLARAHGLRPLERLAAGLSLAVARREPATVRAAWLERMRDAAGCEETGEDAADACVAAVMVRLAG